MFETLAISLDAGREPESADQLTLIWDETCYSGTCSEGDFRTPEGRIARLSADEKSLPVDHSAASTRMEPQDRKEFAALRNSGLKTDVRWAQEERSREIQRAQSEAKRVL